MRLFVLLKTYSCILVKSKPTMRQGAIQSQEKQALKKYPKLLSLSFAAKTLSFFSASNPNHDLPKINGQFVNIVKSVFKIPNGSRVPS